MKKKIKQLIDSLIEGLVSQAVYHAKVKDMYSAQWDLAFEDSQKFIYENSTLKTLSFSGADATEKLYTHCFDELLSDGSLYEFGVFTGITLRKFSKLLYDRNDKRTIYGFDSFKGFSEEWSGLNEQYSKAIYDQDLILPETPDNTKLVPGFIEESLPIFLKSKNPEYVDFIHIDTDTYTPAKTALDLLKPYLRTGSIILFDELCGYPNWRSHEYMALTEVFNESEFEYLGFAHNGPKALLIKAAIRIL